MQFSEEQLLIQDMARSFAQEQIKPNASEWDKHGIFPKDAAGSQIDIMPTLIELIAPKGFEYYSVGKSLTLGNKIGANYAFGITDGYIGNTDEDKFDPEEFIDGKKAPDEAAVVKYSDAIRAVSWWKAQYGNVISEDVKDN